MNLKGEIFNTIYDVLASVHCDNCYSKDRCPREQKLAEGTCGDWSISCELTEVITNDIIDLIRNRLGVG